MSENMLHYNPPPKSLYESHACLLQWVGLIRSHAEIFAFETEWLAAFDVGCGQCVQRQGFEPPPMGLGWSFCDQCTANPDLSGSLVSEAPPAAALTQIVLLYTPHMSLTQCLTLLQTSTKPAIFAC